MITVLLLFLSGLMVGVVSSFFGVGGGIIVIPTLYTIFAGIHPQTAIASSLALIFLNSIMNVRNFTRSGKVVIFKLASVMALFAGIGVLIGAEITTILSPKDTKLVFATLVFVVAIRTIFKKLDKDASTTWPSKIDTKLYILTCSITFVGGIVSGLTGLGGGAVMVPLFLSLLRMPIYWVSPYSNFCMVAATGVGALRYMMMPAQQEVFQNTFLEKFAVGQVNWGIVLSIFMGSFLTSKLGIKLSERISPVMTKNLFVALLIIVSVRIFLKSFGVLS